MSKTSRRHSRYASSSIGNDPYFAATPSRSAARLRCCHSGLRPPGRRFGSSSARAAASRNFAANSAVPPSCRTTSASTSSDAGIIRFGIRRLLGLRKPHHEPVVGPHRFDVEPGFGARALDRRHRPRRVDAPAERREHADAPVAELVAAALDQDRAVVGDDAGGGRLVGQVAQQVLGRLLIEVVVRDEPLNRRRPAAGAAACAPARRSAARARAAVRRRPPSRTASCPARPAPGTRARDRG